MQKIDELPGWALINQGQWQSAFDSFNSLQLANPECAALGIARIATRLGQFEVALKWLREGLYYANKSTDISAQVMLRGALGELLLRSGHNDKALMQMQIARSLLPLGDSRRQLQYSFLAMPIARLGKPQVAEDYYMRAYFIAKLTNDECSMSHALVRRAALVLRGEEQSWLSANELFGRLTSPAKIAIAYMQILWYWHDWNASGKKPTTSKLTLNFTIEGSYEFNLMECLINSDVNFQGQPLKADIFVDPPQSEGVTELLYPNLHLPKLVMPGFINRASKLKEALACFFI